jgi:hypothetical protein
MGVNGALTALRSDSEIRGIGLRVSAHGSILLFARPLARDGTSPLANPLLEKVRLPSNAGPGKMEEKGENAMNIRATAVAGALLAASVPALPVSAHAAPLGWHGGGWHGGGWGLAGLGIGLAAGAIIGGTFAAPYYGYYSPGYYGYAYAPTYGYAYAPTYRYAYAPTYRYSYAAVPYYGYAFPYVGRGVFAYAGPRWGYRQWYRPYRSYNRW